jgi:hypothetical protein
MIETPPGFGVRQPSGAFEVEQSGRGLPQSKTLSRVVESQAVFPRSTIGHDRARLALNMNHLRRTIAPSQAGWSWRPIAANFRCRCRRHFSFGLSFRRLVITWVSNGLRAKPVTLAFPVNEREKAVLCPAVNCRAIIRRSFGTEHRRALERFHKCCSGVLLVVWTAVFLIFGFVSAQSQGLSNLLLHRSLAKNQKSSLHTATSFLSTL